MGSIIMASSILSIFVFIPSQSGLIWKTDVVSPTKNVESNTKNVESDDKEKAEAGDLAQTPSGSSNVSLASEGSGDSNEDQV